MTVHTDSGAGFCRGVIRAISKAEQVLGEEGELYSLGAIVHNGKELSRLNSLGLKTVGHLSDIPFPSGKKVLIRAHGVAPEIYGEATLMGISVTDCTCPVVLSLQKEIRKAYSDMRSSGAGGQILLFGKVGHPEVLGLVGQTDGNTTVIERAHDLEHLVSEGSIDVSRPAELFSQTTGNPGEYRRLCECLQSTMKAPLKVHYSICRQVAVRYEQLSSFAKVHDAVVFVAGADSSNGRVLHSLCLSANPATHLVEGPEDLDPSWFTPLMSVGVSGATSTPQWLLEDVARAIENLQ